MSTFDTRREQSKIVFAKVQFCPSRRFIVSFEPLNNGVIQESTCSVLMVFPSKATRSRPPVKLILRINITGVPILSTSLWGGIPGKVIVFRYSSTIVSMGYRLVVTPVVSSMLYATHYVLFGSVSSAVPAFLSHMSSNQFENVWMVSRLCSGIPNARYDLMAGAEKQPLEQYSARSAEVMVFHRNVIGGCIHDGIVYQPLLLV
nr:hypothetical protein [Tanacetum cinerariifolium]